jgi:hypothetical protein
MERRSMASPSTSPPVGLGCYDHFHRSDRVTGNTQINQEWRTNACEKYDDIATMTAAAQRYFGLNRSKAKLVDGKLKLPNDSVFMPDGRIVTFW